MGSGVQLALHVDEAGTLQQPTLPPGLGGLGPLLGRVGTEYLWDATNSLGPQGAYLFLWHTAAWCSDSFTAFHPWFKLYCSVQNQHT